MLRNAVDLGLHLAELRRSFLPEVKLKQLSEPADFEKDLDARAFLVLAHSAFEQFFEDTAVDVAQIALNGWLRNTLLTKQIAVTVACITSSIGDLGKVLTGKKSDVGTDAATTEPRAVLTTLLREAITTYRVSVIDENHGTDMHYLRSIFVPIGISVFPPPDARSALTHISNARGSFAHRRTTVAGGKFAYLPIAAEKALSSTQALFHWCLEFENDLAASLEPSYLSLHAATKKELIERLTKALVYLTKHREKRDAAK
jgi:hypothetical protein